ncbi:MAG: hypothetical protein V3R87_07525 [Dehalococcoidia bacterium]
MITGIGRLRGTKTEQLARWRAVFRLFRVRSWLVAAVAGLATLALIGIPTSILANPFFIRMLPVRAQDYVIWIVTGILAGLVAGTYTLPAGGRSEVKVASGGFLSFLAVGCPICNKLVLLLLGTSGALTYFAPAQLFIGIASVALLGWALHMRVQAINRACCAVPEQMAAPDTSADK